jgi:hypothetical protein
MARITVRPIGDRNAGVSHCVICGTKRSLGNGVCANMCHWLLPGWVGYNAVLKEVKFTDHRALSLAASLHSWDAKRKVKKAVSFTKLVAAARQLGWQGDTATPSQPTFVEVA